MGRVQIQKKTKTVHAVARRVRERRGRDLDDHGVQELLTREQTGFSVPIALLRFERSRYSVGGRSSSYSKEREKI